jgi:predicted enzyme related to lactoylglutathione lyase
MDSRENSRFTTHTHSLPRKNNPANTPFVSCLLPLASAILFSDTITTHSEKEARKRRRKTTMATTPALNFVIFYVSDMEKALTFFTKQLGLEHDPSQDAPNFRGFKVPAGSLPFGLSPATNQTPPAGTTEVYFSTDDLAGVHDALAKQGVKTTEIMTLPFGSIFGVAVPDGLHVVMLRPAGH